MHRTTLSLTALTALVFSACAATAADHAGHPRALKNTDVFSMEWALDPQISPNGEHVIYLRQQMDIMTDRALRQVWIVDTDGGNHRPVLADGNNYSSVRWSPDGGRIAYITRDDDRGAELYVRWMDTGQTALLSNLPKSPSNIRWSPDGSQIAFQMFVASKPPSLAKAPAKPKGAKWAPPVTVIEDYPYRRDGGGYLETGFSHVFVIPAEGGTPRQLTNGDFNHRGTMGWSPDGSTIALSANRVANPNSDFVESEIWLVSVADGDMRSVTDRDGADRSPVFSADGKAIVYLGFDDEGKSAHITQAYRLELESGEVTALTPELDRSIGQLLRSGDRDRFYVSFDDRGRRVVARLDVRGGVTPIVDDVGSASVGRPYTSGSFSVADDGTIAYTRGTPTRPSEVAVVARAGEGTTLTALNDDLFKQRDAGPVEEITWKSSVGDYDVQGWLVMPPGFDPNKKYPMILEIHGGPHTAYGPHFSPEIQLFAAAGYVVFYTNPRGSTSYGSEFMHEIHLAYPGEDYDDLMSGVDAVIERGYVDADQLFVTGGSGGGVLTAWIVGKTDRFAAAVVAKPVINWVSELLTTDIAGLMSPYWFEKYPWEDIEEYWRRSPLSLVGNVTTPTMLMAGEQDFRTPMPESEQYYQALKLLGVDTALVRVPERSHTIVGRPTHLIAKADNILAWFARYRTGKGEMAK
ncbi:MAG: S9 family peptidase [Pseudomonadota bacterium]